MTDFQVSNLYYQALDALKLVKTADKPVTAMDLMRLVQDRHGVTRD